MKKLLLYITLAMATPVAGAQTFESGGLAYRVDGPDRVTVVAKTDAAGHNLYDGVMIIPETVFYDEANYAVAAIADSAFFASTVTEVQVGNQVTSIGQAAFAQATALHDITLPVGLEAVSPHMLQGTAITTIALPDGTTRVGDGAFDGCHSLRSVMLPQSMQRIGREAFNDCPSLVEIYCAAHTPPLTEPQGVKGVELVVPDDTCADAYQQHPVWGNFEAFSMWTADELDVTLRLTDEPALDGNWQRLSLGGGMAYRIYDEQGYLMALTAADNFYLPPTRRSRALTIVPTNLLAQAPAVEHHTQPTPVADLEQERTHPIITAHDGTVHVHGDNYGTWTQVYDVYGMLWYQRPSVDGVIVLPISRSYIIIVGDYVKKIWL